MSLEPPGKDELRRLALTIAEWAESLPIERAFIFGSRVRGDNRPDSDLDVAIQRSSSPSCQETMNWINENKSNFECLKGALGVTLSLHLDEDDIVWPAIFNAARTPVFSTGKVCGVVTPKKTW